MKILIIFFILIMPSAKAIEIACEFEEVYSNGEHQNGFTLIKDQKIRYQYFDQTLFTIFLLDENIYIVKNSDRSITQKLNQDKALITNLFSVLLNYPNIENQFQKEDLEISLENSLNTGFFKRVSIKSDNLNMSIYFNKCKSSELSNHFFIFNPFTDYKIN